MPDVALRYRHFRTNMASSCRRNVNFARKCSLTHLQAQRKFTSAGCHPQVGTAIQYSTYVPCVRTVRLYSTSIQYVRTALYMYRYPVRIGCTVHTVQYCVYPARRKCQIVELLRQRKKAAESCSGNLRRMPFRDVNDGRHAMQAMITDCLCRERLDCRVCDACGI